MLKLVEVAKKIQATQVSTNSEGVVCQNNLSPPVDKPDSTITLDKATTTQSKAVGISTKSDAGEADEVSNSSKGA